MLDAVVDAGFVSFHARFVGDLESGGGYLSQARGPHFVPSYLTSALGMSDRGISMSDSHYPVSFVCRPMLAEHDNQFHGFTSKTKPRMLITPSSQHPTPELPACLRLVGRHGTD